MKRKMERKGKITVTVAGKEYPCYTTMGAMLRFKQETGREVTDIDGGLSDVVTYLWCCVCSACKREGIGFDMGLMDFADAVDQSEMEAWAGKMNSGSSEEDASADAKKKKVRK